MDIRTFTNSLFRILRANLKMSVPKMCDVCHMHMSCKSIAITYFFTTRFAEFKTIVRGFFRRAGGRTPPPEIDFSPPEIFDKKRFLNFVTRKIACFSGKIPPNFRFSPPGKFHFLPFPTWKKPEKKPCYCL